MEARVPVVEIDARYSSAGADPLPWAEARALVEAASLFWLSTVRPTGHPHVTPLIAVWVDDALCFCTGPDERKARNLAGNPSCILMTGRNLLDEGIDVVVEGDAVNVRDETKLQRIADAYVTKYGPDWTFTVRDGAFEHEEGTAIVFEVAPSTAFAFVRGDVGGQTRFRFQPGAIRQPTYGQ